MSKKTNLNFIVDIMDRINLINKRINGLSCEDFSKNDLLVEAITLCVIIIGEAISKVDLDILVKYNPDKKYWLKIKDTRNYFVHDYDTIDSIELYKIVTKHIPVLETYITKIFDDLEKELG